MGNVNDVLIRSNGQDWVPGARARDTRAVPHRTPNIKTAFLF